MSRAQVYVAVQFALFAALAVTLFAFPPGQIPLPRIIGLILVASALVVLTLAALEYRRINASLPNIVPTPDARAELVTSGIYSQVRHPIYTAVLLGGLGMALAHGHGIPLLVAVALILFFIIKARYEETLLSKAYPQYTAYMERTGRFLPFL